MNTEWAMAAKLNTAPYRGTRDFLPEEMSMRSQVFGTLYRVIESYGYTRYDGPTLESIELYEAKSGQEIVGEQLYRLTDRSGRELAIRPEMTPSVARIVAANAPRLQFPVRWYTHANCHRYERPQRGRIREHWQINVDIFGSESVEAEVEIFELIHRIFAALGATPADFVLRVSDRRLIGGALATYARVTSDQLKEVSRVIDRWEKYPIGEVQAALSRIGLDDEQVERVCALVALDLDAYAQIVPHEELMRSSVARIFREQLTEAPLKFDPLIVRGFDYYTSTVFEVFDVSPENRRSLFGGGRYDNLVALFNDRRIPGIGFGMGDVTLFDFLETHRLLPQPAIGPDVCVIALSADVRAPARAIADELRAAGLRVITPLEQQGLAKELKHAARRGTRFAVIVGEDELARGNVVLRELARSEQREVARSRLCEAVRQGA